MNSEDMMGWNKSNGHERWRMGEFERVVVGDMGTVVMVEVEVRLRG